MNRHPQPSPLARFLLIAYVLLVVYATLFPFAGWQDPRESAFAYLSAPWPRYYTGFDIAANVIGYLPFGALAVFAAYPRVRGLRAILIALAAGAGLTIALEAAQSFISSRIASNLDVLCNLAGTFMGAVLGVRSAAWLFDAGPLRRLRADWVVAGAHADAGVVLLALWILTQLDPTVLLFGAGDLRELMPGLLVQALPATLAAGAYDANVFISIEARTAACNLLAVGLMASAILTPAAPARLLLLLLVGAALTMKLAAFAVLREATGVLDWATPGGLIGLAAGVTLLMFAVSLPRALRLALAAVLLMTATVLVNLAPPNPYLASTLAVWAQGHFLNFNGLTRLLSMVWPFVACAYLIFLAARGAPR